MMMFMPACSAPDTLALIEEITVRLEEANAQNQWKRNLRSRGADNPRVTSDFADSRLDGAQHVVFDKVAFVEQDRVCIAKLVMDRDAVKALQAEVFGIRDGDDRIDANPIAKLRAQERQNYRQDIGYAG